MSERDYKREAELLYLLINRPAVADFFKAVKTETAHQPFRWGPEHDRAKSNAEFLEAVIYLLGKSVRAHYDGDQEKRLHHLITAAACIANWHAAIVEDTAILDSINELDRTWVNWSEDYLKLRQERERLEEIEHMATCYFDSLNRCHINGNDGADIAENQECEQSLRELLNVPRPTDADSR